MNEESQMPWCAIFLAIAAIATLVFILTRDDGSRETRRICEDQVKLVLEGKPITAQDYWKHDLRSNLLTNKDAKIATITSAGKDGDFGTNDDITVVRTKYNVARVIGKETGKAIVRFKSGFKEGVKSAEAEEATK